MNQRHPIESKSSANFTFRPPLRAPETFRRLTATQTLQANVGFLRFCAKTCASAPSHSRHCRAALAGAECFLADLIVRTSLPAPAGPAAVRLAWRRRWPTCRSRRRSGRSQYSRRTIGPFPLPPMIPGSETAARFPSSSPRAAHYRHARRSAPIATGR
jgi:hypothetical protein